MPHHQDALDSPYTCDDCPEKKRELDAFIASLDENAGKKKTRSFLIPILRKAQEIYRYIPHNIQHYIAEVLNLSFSEVYGVISFYSLFTTEESGKHRICVCTGTACHVKGSGKVYEELKAHLGLEGEQDTTDDKLFTLERVNCVGACGLAPVMSIDEEIHSEVTPKKAVAAVAAIEKAEAEGQQ